MPASPAPRPPFRLLLALTLSPLAAALAPAPALGGSSFEPGLTHRPRLTFDGRDPAHTARLVARVDAQEEPWASAYRALRSKAETGQAVSHGTTGWRQQPDPYVGLYEQEAKNGELASAKAMVAWLYARGLDPVWLPLPRLPGEASPAGWIRQQAREARQIVEGLYDDWPCYRGFKVVNRGIVAADALVTHCVAYDLLAALPRSERGDLERAERRLGNLASDLRFWYWTVDPQNDNHPVRVAAGLGVAAVTLNTHRRYRWYEPGTWWHRPKGWMKKASRNLHPTGRASELRYQLRTGACAEGTSYAQYSADLYLPFFYAYARFLGGRGVPFLRSDLVNDVAWWGMELRLPDGRRGQVDNARLFRDPTNGFFLSRAAGASRSVADQQALLWDWKDNGYPGMTGRRAPFLLAAFDPDPALVTQASAMSGLPLTPTRFMERRGAAVLRTGWGPDAAYALVQAQHGEVRKRGTGHHSVDNGAYVFFTHGDLITIDPGYFGFSQVEKTHKGEHRSMVLVDSRAPKPAHKRLWGALGWASGGTDTKIVRGPRTQEGAEVRSVEVETEYRKADLRRTVALVETRYLLVEDRCRGRKEHDFTTQVQANAGAAEGRPLQVAGDVVRYETQRGRVQACVGAAASAPLRLRTSVRDSHFGEGPDGHEAIEVTARGRDVTILTAIAASPAGQAAPEVERLTATGGGLSLRVVAGGRVDVVVSNPAGVRVTVPQASGTRPVETTQTLVIVSFDATGAGRVVWAVGAGSTAIQ